VDAVNAVPVVGTPLAYGLGSLVLLMVAFTDSWGRSLVTVAHEGGHAAVGVLTFRGLRGFDLHDGGGGLTDFDRLYWSISDLLMRIAGYPTPPLLGLGGAVLVSRGQTDSVLWIGLVLLIAMFLIARNKLAILVTLLAVLGVGYVVFAGGLIIRAAVAVTLVWWMLIGGAYWATTGLFRGGTQDASMLEKRTWIPRVVWDLGFAAVGIFCVWVGGKLLLRH